MKLTAAILLIIALAGCGKTAKVSAPPAPLISPNTPREFIDLEAGMRLRIVAAVTKSGAYEVKTAAVKQEGTSLAVKLTDDFIGYETAFWSIAARSGGGVSVLLDSATLTVKGTPSAIDKPTRALVHVPHSARYLRAFYLTRKSDADHNMALAGAARPDQLDALARAFHDSPNEACESFSKQRHYCEWIPAGLAVRPESPIGNPDGSMRWPNQ